ncbi:SPOR domain-containing protein [Vogesella sp. GCM10023246]|uniref:SPOR domain-containing protein n=1 Tax=Vogesella oryzagri TaxID=3160864 RepID=A0ABV1M509_9NEIS
MKWLLGALLVLNLFAGLYALIKQKPERDLKAQEVNAAQLKLLPPDWQPPQLASSAMASAPLAETASAPLAQPASAPAVAKPAADKGASQPAAVPPKTVAKPAVAQSVTPPLAPAKAVDGQPAAPLNPADAKQATAKVAANLCRNWGPLDPKQLERVQGGLPSLQLATAPAASVKEELRGSGRIWVFYPPLATQAETQTLVSELRSKGFDSYIVKTDGAFKNHLSLGLFSKLDAAQALLQRLKTAGYDKAKLDVRGEHARITTLSFKALDEATLARLKALQQRLLPGIPLQDCR